VTAPAPHDPVFGPSDAVRSGQKGLPLVTPRSGHLKLARARLLWFSPAIPNIQNISTTTACGICGRVGRTSAAISGRSHGSNGALARRPDGAAIDQERACVAMIKREPGLGVAWIVTAWSAEVEQNERCRGVLYPVPMSRRVGFLPALSALSRNVLGRPFNIAGSTRCSHDGRAGTGVEAGESFHTSEMRIFLLNPSGAGACAASRAPRSCR